MHEVQKRDQPQGDQHYLFGSDGIYRPSFQLQHRDDEYDAAGFDVLLRMQSEHFWYRGRHRFLLAEVRRQVDRSKNSAHTQRACDLGGGCGGWIQYLRRYDAELFAELAIADSSINALEHARAVVGDAVRRYQIDLLQLQWRERWDALFLLDVLEHIPEDVEALRQIHQALRPGGLLFVTTPALKFFWSYNDEVASHQRRYSKADFQQLAKQSGLELLNARYFMFYLSPILFVARRKRPELQRMTAEEIRSLMGRTHRVPVSPINEALAAIFAMETPLGLWLPFPWGTSILGVFRKPCA